MYYGRNNEIEQLKHHFKYSSNDKNSLFIINGFSGSGKTELVKEVSQKIYRNNNKKKTKTLIFNKVIILENCIFKS